MKMDKMKEIIRSALTLLSPELNTRVNYYFVHHKRLNLKTPISFEEKILWLKLNKYINDPLVIKCADKFKVREYIKECGYQDILNEMIDVYDTVEDIDWECLPNQFVLKWNFGCGYNLICKDKGRFNIEQAQNILRIWGKKKCWLPYSEMQYKYAPKKIICEKYLEDKKNINSLPDYKVYCFHGNPLAILVMHDRGAVLKREMFDINWNRLENPSGTIAPDEITPKPECLEKMIKVSSTLSTPFPFVRCDYYIVNGKLVFGEMTFTPAGGIYFTHTKLNGKDMAEYLHVPN